MHNIFVHQAFDAEEVFPWIREHENYIKIKSRYMYIIFIMMLYFLFVRFQVDLIRVATCNLHTQMISEGVSVAVEKVKVQQYVSHQPGKGSRSKINQISPAPWLECGSVCFGPLHLDSTIYQGSKMMNKAQAYFLKVHDRRSQR